MAEPARKDTAALDTLGIPMAARAAFVVEPDDIDVPPENWPAVRLMRAMQTQWRVGMGGRTGLVYEALPTVMRLTGIAPADDADTFAALQVMEIEMLQTWSAQK